MNIQILTPQEKVFIGFVQSVILPGKNGPFQLLNLHASIISILIHGNIIFEVDANSINQKINKNIKISGNKLTYLIEGGILKMNNNQVLILCD